MRTYEEKLAAFARGKRLLRLARPIRDRADALCDACGSTQPRTLYTLKDRESDRYYFVGDTCLKELVKRGAILKPFGKESGQAAYEAEMQLRAQELKERTAIETIRAGIQEATQEGEPLAADARSASARGVSFLLPAVLIIEAPERYQAFVSILSAQGTPCSWGYAQESRYEEIWRRGGEGGLVLEKVKEERLDAPSRCLTQAWEEARSRLEGSELVTPLPDRAGGDTEERSLSDPILALFKLAAITYVGSHAAPASSNGNLVASG